jgi:hypothetical protein
MTPQQRIWDERLRRACTSRELIEDPVVRQLQRRMKRAVADADTYEQKIEAIHAASSRIGEHLGLGPRPR